MNSLASATVREREAPASDLRWADLAFSALLAVLLAAVLVRKHLSADGVHYFVTILDSGDFTRVAWSRQFANHLTQWPLLLAVKAGLSDVRALTLVYGAGLLAPFAIAYSLLRRLVAAGRLGDLVLWSYLAAVVTITLPASALLVGEHHLLAPLAWLLLGIVAASPANGRARLWTLITITTALALTRVYETALVLQAILTVDVVRRERVRRRVSPAGVEPLFRRAQPWIVATLLLAGMAVAVEAIARPDDPVHRASFVAALTASLAAPATLLPLAAVAAYFAGLRWPRGRQALLLLLAAGLLFAAWDPLSREWAMTSFGARSLTAWWLPALLAVTSLALWRGRRSLPAPRWAARLLVLACLSDLPSSWVWRDLTRQIERAIAATTEPFVPVELHRLDRHPAHWRWTFPELSLVLAAPCRASVLLNPPGGWQPFDPRQGLPLGRFLDTDPACRSRSTP